MRHVVYGGAMSLDGYIAGPFNEYDWIPPDPDIDFAAHMARFDTFLIGRKTFDVMCRAGGVQSSPGIRNIVFSRTLTPESVPAGIDLSADAVGTVRALGRAPGKDIALFGGGELFQSLLAAGLVDRVEMALVPCLLGGGIPMLAPPAVRTALRYLSQRHYPKSGMLLLEYEVLRP